MTFADRVTLHEARGLAPEMARRAARLSEARVKTLLEPSNLASGASSVKNHAVSMTYAERTYAERVQLHEARGEGRVAPLRRERPASHL